MEWIKQILRFVVIMLLQLLLINQLQFFGICRPYIYLMCLLMMPITLPVSVDMLIGMAVGLLMDILSNSIGVHMAACVVVMYARQRIIHTMITESERLTSEISLVSIGAEAFIRYTIGMIVVHHSIVFIMSAWSIDQLGWTILRIIVSGMVSAGLILLYNFVRSR